MCMGPAVCRLTDRDHLKSVMRFVGEQAAVLHCTALRCLLLAAALICASPALPYCGTFSVDALPNPP